VNYWKEEGGIPYHGVVHLKETVKQAKYFSVRNDGSHQRFLEQVGIDVPVVPDPGFHLELDRVDTAFSRPIEEPYVLIQLANDKPLSRFGSQDQKDAFVHQMRAVVKKIVCQFRVIFAPHVFDDISLSREISSGIHGADIWDFGTYAFDNSKTALAYYKHAEFVIAMRGHGQIVPIAFGTPVIALENHPKHKGLMVNLGLEEYSLSVKEGEFSDSLESMIQNIMINRRILVERLKDISKSLDIETSNAILDLKKSIGKQ
jgi:polysaccharide pyruvyl transferase WcaK-like protein